MRFLLVLAALGAAISDACMIGVIVSSGASVLIEVGVAVASTLFCGGLFACVWAGSA